MNKYTVYITRGFCIAEDDLLIATAPSYQEACKRLSAWLKENTEYTDPYWRFILEADATYVDFGSWSRFAAIVPPITTEEMMGES